MDPDLAEIEQDKLDEHYLPVDWEWIREETLGTDWDAGSLTNDD